LGPVHGISLVPVNPNKGSCSIYAEVKSVIFIM